MMRALAPFIICLITFASAARAQPDCAVVDDLRRVGFALVALEAGAMGSERIGHISRMIGIADQLDEDRVQFEFAGAADNRQLVAALGLLREATRAAATPVNAYKIPPSVSAMLDWADTALLVPDCTFATSFRANEQPDEKGDTSTGDAGIGEKAKKPIPPEIFALIGSIAGIVVGFGIRWLIKRRKGPQNRSKRHPIDCQFEVRTVSEDLVMRGLDVSVTGIKLRHNLSDTNLLNTAAEIMIEGEWRRARVAWANDYYLGLNLERKLRRRTIAWLTGLASTDSASDAPTDEERRHGGAFSTT